MTLNYPLLRSNPPMNREKQARINANEIREAVAIRMKLGKAVVQLKEEMNNQYLSKHIQFVTISRPSAYGEYAPYHFVTRFQFRRIAMREVADSAPQGRKGKGKRRRKGVKTMSCRAQRAMRRVR
ncbi:MAG: DUF6718 family protein [Christensenellales bacterium]